MVVIFTCLLKDKPVNKQELHYFLLFNQEIISFDLGIILGVARLFYWAVEARFPSLRRTKWPAAGCANAESAGYSRSTVGKQRQPEGGTVASAARRPWEPHSYPAKPHTPRERFDSFRASITLYSRATLGATLF